MATQEYWRWPRRDTGDGHTGMLALATQGCSCRLAISLSGSSCHPAESAGHSAQPNEPAPSPSLTSLLHHRAPAQRLGTARGAGTGTPRGATELRLLPALVFRYGMDVP